MTNVPARWLLIACSAGLVACSTTAPAPREGYFVTRSAAKSPAALHQAIRDYAQRKNWIYVGDNKLKNGDVTQVRLCIREAAGNIWNAGMQVAALLPCGQMSIYQETGATKITMLHPRAMTLLDPNPIVAKLADDVTGPFMTMLDEVTK